MSKSEWIWLAIAVVAAWRLERWSERLDARLWDIEEHLGMHRKKTPPGD